MNDELVTVATYWMSIEAHLAKNRLEDVGIPAFVIDELTVDNNWGLANAVGGVKVQVAAENADRAEEILASPPVAEMGEEWDHELTHDTESSEEAAVLAEANRVDAEASAGEMEQLCNEREQTANRALKAAIFGLAFLPLQLWVFWLLLKVYVSDEPLAPKPRWAALAAAGISLPIVFFGLIILNALVPW